MLTAPTLHQIETIVRDRIRAILTERGDEVGHLSGAEKLSDGLGLSSLDLAFLVADLEAALGVDPFAKHVSITSVRSVADLVRSYQQAFLPEVRREGDNEAIAAAAKQGRIRRARREKSNGRG